MNFFALFQRALRGPDPASPGTTVLRSDEEQLPWSVTAGDVLVVIFTIVAAVLLHVVLSPSGPAFSRWMSPLAPAALLLVFAEAFVGRRKNALAAALYPGLVGFFLTLAAVKLLAPHVGSASSVALAGSLWALTGLFFWQRFQAPSAVAQVVAGVFVAVVVPTVMLVYRASTGGGGAALVSGLIYVTAFSFGATCAWLGRKFDRLDIERTQVHSKIAFWFHSKGAIGMTWGLVLPYVSSGISNRLSMQLSTGLESWVGVLCLLMGCASVLLSLRWNRKYYLAAGASLLTLGLLRLLHVAPLGLALGVLLGLTAILYFWDALSVKLRIDAH